MAKSLLNQFTQTRGSRTYSDDLTMALAELAGRSLHSGLLVTITGNATVTQTNGSVFEENDLGNYIVIGGVAYEITAYTSSTVVTVGGSPGDGAGQNAAVHSRKNLEDDLNYIRTQLELIVGEINWNDVPDATLSGIRTELDNLSGTFLGLTDTYVDSYVADNMLYTSSSGVHDTSDMTYDPDTGDIRMGADGGARVMIDADSSTTIYGDDDSYVVISGAGGEVTQGGDLRMSLTDQGLALESGARVNNIIASTIGIDASSLDTDLATAKSIYDSLGGTALSGTPTEMYFVGADGNMATSSGMTWVDDKGMDVLNHMAIGGSATLDHPWGATYSNVLYIAEIIPSNYTDGGTGLAVYVETEASDSFNYLTAADFTAYGPGLEHYRIAGGSFFGNQTGVSGVVVDVLGVLGAVGGPNESATVTNMIGGKFYASANTNYSTSTTITNLTGGDFAVNPNNANSGANLSITNAYGIHIKAAGTTNATATNKYGLYVADQASGDFTNEYNIYSTGASSANVFEGTVAAKSLKLTDSTIYSNETLNVTDGDSIDSSSTDIQLASAKLIYDTIATVSGAINDGLIWEIVDTPTDQIRPRIAYLDYAIYTEGNVTIGGDLTVTGTLFYTDTETVQVSDNILHINYGETGDGVTAGEAGMQVDRGSEEDYFFIFDEGTDTFRVGVSGVQDSFNDTTLQPVATREDNPIDTRVPWWQDSSNTFRTQGDTYITVNSGTDTIAASVADTNVLSLGNTEQILGKAAGANILVSQDNEAFSGWYSASNNLMLRVEDTLGRMGVSGDTYVEVNTTNNDLVVYANNVQVMELGTSDWWLGSGETEGTHDFIKIAGDDSITYALQNSGSEHHFLTASGNQLDIGDSGIQLANDGGVGSPWFNEVLNAYDGDSIDASSTDKQLATAKLIYNTLSGTNHSGTPTYMYYVDDSGDMATTSEMVHDKDGGKLFAIDGDSETYISADGGGSYATMLNLSMADRKPVDSFYGLNISIDSTDTSGDNLLSGAGGYIGSSVFVRHATVSPFTDVNTSAYSAIVITVSGSEYDEVAGYKSYVNMDDDSEVQEAYGVKSYLVLSGDVGNFAVGMESYVLLNDVTATGAIYGSRSTVLGNGGSVSTTPDTFVHYSQYRPNTNTTTDDAYLYYGYADTGNGTITNDMWGIYLTGVDKNFLDGETTMDSMVLETGLSVNEIQDSLTGAIDVSSTDDQLATAKLIYNEIQDITTGSGQVDHNLLAGLQGGTTDEYYHITSNENTAFSSDGSTFTFTQDLAGVDLDLSGTFSFDSGTTVDEIVSTVDTNSTDSQLPTAEAVWELVGLYDPHTHYEIDLTLSGSNVWTVTSGVVSGMSTDDMDVYLNGLLNRDHTDYFTALVEGSKLTVTFAYNTYESDWTHVKFLKITA